MELKKYIYNYYFFKSYKRFIRRHHIQPTKNLSAYDVVKIQLNALKNNNESKK